MKKMIRILVCALAALTLVVAPIALANTGVSVKTSVTLRVTTVTQSAIVDIGDDLLIDIAIEGADPAVYNWYFNDELIPGADSSSYDILSATPEDAGIYRMDGFDANGNMLVSVDMSVRVNDPAAMPKSGDDSISRTVLFGMMAASMCVLGVAAKRKKA